jgi:hypothetical protein
MAERVYRCPGTDIQFALISGRHVQITDGIGHAELPLDTILCFVAWLTGAGAAATMALNAKAAPVPRAAEPEPDVEYERVADMRARDGED